MENHLRQLLRIIRIVALLALCPLTSPLFAQGPEAENASVQLERDRPPVPSLRDRTAAARELETLFSEQLSDWDAARGKAMVERMLQAAEESTNPQMKWALFDRAAREAGSLRAFELLHRVVQQFQDAFVNNQAVVSHLINASRNATEANWEQVEEIVAGLLSRGDYAAAQRLMLGAASALRSSLVRTEAQNLLRDVSAIHRQSGAVERARATLL